MPWLYSPVVKDSDRAIELMESLVSEMESRYQRFATARCADLGTYNQRAHKPLPRIICIFDEYADFMAEKESRTALEQSIKRLGAMARAAGIAAYLLGKGDLLYQVNSRLHRLQSLYAQNIKTPSV